MEITPTQRHCKHEEDLNSLEVLILVEVFAGFPQTQSLSDILSYTTTTIINKQGLGPFFLRILKVTFPRSMLIKCLTLWWACPIQKKACSQKRCKESGTKAQPPSRSLGVSPSPWAPQPGPETKCVPRFKQGAQRWTEKFQTTNTTTHNTTGRPPKKSSAYKTSGK